MITALVLDGFKGIEGRQRIEFAPLTLLFGANSAGKSTILQALLYLDEILQCGSADVDRTELGGSVLELGGFARLVHRHDTNRAIVVSVEFGTPGSLERFGRDLGEFPLPDLDDEVESAWLELTIRSRTTPTFRGAVVDVARLGINQHQDPLVWLGLGPSLREGEPLFVRVNTRHPVLHKVGHPDLGNWSDVAVPIHSQKSLFAAEGEVSVPEDFRVDEDPTLPVFALARSWNSALPSFRDPLRVLVPGGDEPSRRERAALEQVRNFLEMVVLGTTAQLADYLRDARYIGPLRTLPPRGYLYERVGRLASWADGLAAWDLLLADRVNLVEQTNTWLRRLGASCQVKVQQLFDEAATAEELADGHVDKTARRLLLDTGAGSFVLPSEVGAGVSQVIPIVVGALGAGSGLLLVEQPEIHVHPAVQVGLGDLFVGAMTGAARRGMLVETHSEHLLLRVMRRMRETAEGKLPEGAPPVRPVDVRVLFIERIEGRTIIRQMPLNERGELVKAWPGGFFEEGLKEVL